MNHTFQTECNIAPLMDMTQHKINLAGIPQRSSLGLILSLVYINDLSSALEHSETNLFADDTNLTCTAKMISEAHRIVTDDLLVSGIWLAANEFSPNLVKTKYIILAASPKLEALDFSVLIKLNGNPVKRVSKN